MKIQINSGTALTYQQGGKKIVEVTKDFDDLNPSDKKAVAETLKTFTEAQLQKLKTDE